jgi:hypothetical protein
MKLEIIKCPSCGGSLTVTGEMDIVECAYCDNTVRVRESLILMNENRSENFLEMAKNAYEAQNYDESLRYVNKALETDINNPQANEIKALVCFGAHYENSEKMIEGLYYAKKAIDNYPEKEKPSCREKIIKNVLETDLQREHIPLLVKMFDSIGKGEKRILFKIMEISYNGYLNFIKHGILYRNDEDIKDYNKALKALLQTDAREYETAVKKQSEKYNEAIEFRKTKLKEEWRKLFKRGIKVTFAIAVFVNLFISGALKRIISPGGNGSVIIVFFSILGLLYLVFINYSAKAQIKDFELKKYGENLVYK